jgi:Mrp family chromosome partitioning ATPase
MPTLSHSRNLGIPPASLSLAIGPIEYTQTKQVEVNREFLRRQRVIAGLEPTSYTDAFKVLRTRVLQRMREKGWRTLGVTSPNAGAGTTLVAINLALSLALEVTQTVLLVDVNLRDPGIHDYFGLTPGFGLGDHLLDQVPIERILLHPRGIERFVLLPGNRPLPGSAELLSSPRTAELVSELKHRYTDRLVVFDLPPLQTADTLAFAPLLDCLLLVAGAGRTGRNELAQALEHLRGIPILGTVLNDAESIQGD